MFKLNLSYSSVNTARSAISSFIMYGDKGIGEHPLIIKFMKGVYQQRPTQSRYTCVWSVHNVFDFLRQSSSNENLTLKLLSMKTVMLLALISAQRVQTLHNLCLSNMSHDDVNCKIMFNVGKIKQSRPGFKSLYITVGYFNEEE